MEQADKVFGTDVYYNEDNRLESNYQERFWGRQLCCSAGVEEGDRPQLCSHRSLDGGGDRDLWQQLGIHVHTPYIIITGMARHGGLLDSRK